MRPPRVRFTIRWLMETTAILAVVFWLLRAPAVAMLLMIYSVLYHFGFAPMRRLYGFCPVRRFFARWAWGHLPASPDGRTRDDGGMSPGSY
jgi:hypothetical protein